MAVEKLMNIIIQDTYFEKRFFVPFFTVLFYEFKEFLSVFLLPLSV